MANPVRNYDDPRTRDPRVVEDSLNPVPPLGPDPRTPEPRYASNDPAPGSTTVVKADRGTGTGVLIAAVVIVLAVIAFFVFGRNGADMPADTVTAPGQPAVTEPAAPGASAPEAAPPAGQAAPAPEATAPAEPAAPAQPAPEAAEPAPTEPAQPAPAQ
ncbi:hypothetical protein RHIZO_00404 [Rhizobiaceae bacterium]|nr:hypothetical protein RHIZO_00404 [Rhizobiaceae bacterium]